MQRRRRRQEMYMGEEASVDPAQEPSVVIIQAVDHLLLVLDSLQVIVELGLGAAAEHTEFAAERLISANFGLMRGS